MKKYKVIRFSDAEFGCEERGDNLKPRTSVLLEDSVNVERIWVEMDDDWIEQSGIKPGKSVILGPDGIYRKLTEVVAAVIVKGGKFFATARGYGDWKGWWEFPGGKVEPGETPEEALRREIMEELDTEISVDRYLCTAEYDYPAFHLSMGCYISHVVKGELVLLEAEDAKWLTLDDMDTVKWLPADLQVVEALREWKQF